MESLKHGPSGVEFRTLYAAEYPDTAADYPFRLHFLTKRFTPLSPLLPFSSPTPRLALRRIPADPAKTYTNRFTRPCRPPAAAEPSPSPPSSPSPPGPVSTFPALAWSASPAPSVLSPFSSPGIPRLPYASRPSLLRSPKSPSSGWSDADASPCVTRAVSGLSVSGRTLSGCPVAGMPKPPPHISAPPGLPSPIPAWSPAISPPPALSTPLAPFTPLLFTPPAPGPPEAFPETTCLLYTSPSPRD